jgi:hypothetical protein
MSEFSVIETISNNIRRTWEANRKEKEDWVMKRKEHKGNNKITELRTILQRESQNS